jgi:hypothetical protein
MSKERKGRKEGRRGEGRAVGSKEGQQEVRTGGR